MLRSSYTSIIFSYSEKSQDLPSEIFALNVYSLDFAAGLVSNPFVVLLKI